MYGPLEIHPGAARAQPEGRSLLERHMLRHSRPGMRGILARPLHNGRRHLNALATVRTVVAGLVRLHPPEVRRRGNHRPLRAAVHGRDAAHAFATDRLIGSAELAERVATIVHLPGPEQAR